MADTAGLILRRPVGRKEPFGSEGPEVTREVLVGI
jgi:hypothetical protein